MQRRNITALAFTRIFPNISEAHGTTRLIQFCILIKSIRDNSGKDCEAVSDRQFPQTLQRLILPNRFPLPFLSCVFATVYINGNKGLLSAGSQENRRFSAISFPAAPHQSMFQPVELMKRQKLIFLKTQLIGLLPEPSPSDIP